MISLFDLLRSQTVPSEPDDTITPTWSLDKRRCARPADIPRADQLMLPFRVGVERVSEQDGAAHLEEEGGVREVVVHELHGAEEGVPEP